MSSLNHSPSKALFSFPKSLRFKDPNIQNSGIFYSKDSPSSKMTGSGKPFGSSIKDRFNYLDVKKANRSSIDRYSLDVSDSGIMPNFLDNTQSIRKGPKNFSIGIGRDTSKPLFIDQIMKEKTKQLLSPGPGSYDSKDFFGREGAHLSFAQRLK